nr:hypothetical protein BgiMline_019815 [Biomphalaria glabrata]
MKLFHSVLFLHVILFPYIKGTDLVYPEIVIKTYNQLDSVTNCLEGLISNYDTLVMKVSVTFPPESKDWASYIKMFVTTASQTLIPYLVNLKKGSCYKRQHSGPECYCERHHHHVFNVTCRFLATTDISEAEIHGVLYNYNNSEFRSISEKFPKIYDLSKLKLTVNDVIIQDVDNCSFPIDTQTQTIYFCCSNTPWPCETVIKSKGNTLAQSKHCVTYTSKQLPEPKYTMVYTVCDEEKKSESFICYISNAFPSSNCSRQWIIILDLIVVFRLII